MKLFRIKSNDLNMYVEYIIIGVNGIKVLPTRQQKRAGIYEQDKAEKYVEMLNKENTTLEFVLEGVE